MKTYIVAQDTPGGVEVEVTGYRDAVATVREMEAEGYGPIALWDADALAAQDKIGDDEIGW